MALFGRRRTDVESMRAFERQRGFSIIADQKDKSMIEERVRRFDAERMLDMAHGIGRP